MQCVIGAILAAGSLVMPESPRWLIDTDQNEAGLQVIVDLHGGDPEDVKANEEYQEIKNLVAISVSVLSTRNLWVSLKVLTPNLSAAKTARTLPCGQNTSAACFWPCRRRLSPSSTESTSYLTTLVSDSASARLHTVADYVQ
jgi:hypothetical protein